MRGVTLDKSDGRRVIEYVTSPRAATGLGRRQRDRLQVSLRRDVFVPFAASRSVNRYEKGSTAALRPATMADMSGLDELLTADEVAELLHIPRSTVSEYARRGVLPSIKLGRHRCFVRADVAEAIGLLRLGRAPRQSDAQVRR